MIIYFQDIAYVTYRAKRRNEESNLKVLLPPKSEDRNPVVVSVSNLNSVNKTFLNPLYIHQ
jgi:hypothetical protein